MPDPRVLLLRNPSEAKTDPYDTHLRATHFEPISLAVLETTLVNLDALTSLLSASPREGTKGVVLTSARAANAWWGAVRRLVAPSTIPDPLRTWSGLKFYVVGIATAEAVQHPPDNDRDFPATTPIPTDVRGAAQTGTAESLAQFILDDLSTEARGTELLVLIGDKNRDVLPNVLGEGGVRVQSMQVYETKGREGFGEDMKRIVQENQDDKPWWITFFAPSSSSFALPFLREHFCLSPLPFSNDSIKTQARIAAVGPTTARYLKNEVGLHVDVMAPQPNAEALAKALREFEDVHKC